MVFSLRLSQGIMGGRGLWSHQSVWPLSFPHQRSICAEGLQGRHALSMLGYNIHVRNIQYNIDAVDLEVSVMKLLYDKFSW